jgi:site-specific DNA recombinase
MTAVLRDDEDLLTGWVSQPKAVVRSRRRIEPGPGPLRSAFYGRTSTNAYQDRVSSRQWQRESAHDLITGHGVIVTEFFDVG